MDNIRQLVYKCRDAVVMISGYFINEEDLIIIRGNGFFIKGHYIICPASLIMMKTRLVNKILIGVSDVNGDSLSYSYSGYIVGVDGAANIAILKIHNETIPTLRTCQPFLLWGKSRNCCSGDNILLLGDIIGNHFSENGVCCGYLSDNRYVNGNIVGELLLLNTSITKNNQCGMPILNLEGKIIGMYINENLGLSEFFMRRPIKNIIMTYQKQIISNNTSFINKFVSSDFRYIKSWLAISAIVSSQDDYETTIDRKLLINNKIVSRDIIGYRILSLLDISPLYNILFEGDIITHINGCPLGDRKGQISPSLILWRIYPGDTINVTYKKQQEIFEFVHQCEVKTLMLDKNYDFPHNEILSYVTL
jgi:hypothetical protein